MAKCDKCGKKIFFLNSYTPPETNLTLCEECYKKKDWNEDIKKAETEKKEEIERQKRIEIARQKEIEEEKNMIKEYKRKCNQCGKIWHSQVEFEKNKNTGRVLNSLVAFGSAIGGNSNTSAQAIRNADANLDAAHNLQRCPNCGSTDYTQEIIKFKKK